MLFFELGAGTVLALVALACIHEIGLVGIVFAACAVVPGLWLVGRAGAYGYGCTTVLFLVVHAARQLTVANGGFRCPLKQRK